MTSPCGLELKKSWNVKVFAPTSSNFSPELVETAGQEITLKGPQAIEIYVQVKGQTVHAVLSDASFNKNRANQNSYAEGLDGRLATQEENIAVATALLEKEEQENLNPAEAKLLKTYREGWVRDSQHAIRVYGDRIIVCYDPYNSVAPNIGALVVLDQKDVNLKEELEPNGIPSSVENLK